MSDDINVEEDNVSTPVTRANDYKAIYCNIFRTAISHGELTIVFSKLTHLPGLNVAGSIIEEQIEVALAWPHMKILAATLDSLVQAVEAEVGVIPVPKQFTETMVGAVDRQRTAIRTLGLSAEIPQTPTSREKTPEPPAPPRSARRRKRE
jgi:hypothetical protein